MNKNLRNTAVLIICSGILFSGCGAGNRKSDVSYPSDTYRTASDQYSEKRGTESGEAPMNKAMVAEKAVDMPAPPVDYGDINSAERKLTKNGYIGISVDDIGDMENIVGNIAQKSSGYVFSVDQREYSGTRTVNITIKVKSSEFDNVMNSLKELGKVTSTNFTVDDLTLEYAGTEAEIATLKTKEERLNAILAKAEKIEDILAVETQLQITRQELMSASSRISILKNQTDYSTITVNITDSKGISQNPPENFFERLVSNFRNGFRYWGRTLADVISAVIFALPLILVIALILYFAKRMRKKNAPLSSRVNSISQDRQTEVSEVKGEETEVKEEIIIRDKGKDKEKDIKSNDIRE